MRCIRSCKRTGAKTSKMKNWIKEVFNLENLIRIYKIERSLVLLSVSFAVLSLYSMLSLLMLPDHPVEKKQVEETVLAGVEVWHKRVLSLKKMAFALEERTGSASLLRSSAVAPFRSASGNESRTQHMADEPPEVRVKALIKQGFVRVALIDIDGEESKLMREQNAFGAKGRILRIDNEGVTWVWGTKEFRSLIWE